MKMNNKALVLRVCGDKGQAHGGFVWPLTVGTTVSAPDWEKNKQCGNGLHGWLYGQGELATDYWRESSAKWLVVEVDLEDVVMLGSKCKFPSCIVRFVGDSKSATDFLWEHEGRSRPCAVVAAHRADMTAGAAVQVGPLGHASSGTRGTSTSGYGGTSTSGEGGVLSILQYNPSKCVYERKVAVVGENGIKPGIKYKLDEAGKFVKA